MNKWKTKDCTCRWCQWRSLKTRRQVAHVLGMQLYRHAGRRLAVVFRHQTRHLRGRREKGTALLTLRDFMQTCFKWGAFLEYIDISGRCFGDNYEMRRLVLKMISLINKIQKYPQGGDYLIANIICQRGVEITDRMAPLLSRLRDFEKIEVTLLKKSMRKLVKLRDTWTNAEHRYFDDEVPQFKLDCAQDQATGMILYYDEVDITNEPLDRLARIAAGRLMRMYGVLFENIKRLGQQDMFLQQVQARMDFGCQIVERCLYGGQEIKNGDPTRVTPESGQGGGGLEQNSAEYGGDAARERGVA